MFYIRCLSVGITWAMIGNSKTHPHIDDQTMIHIHQYIFSSDNSWWHTPLESKWCNPNNICRNQYLATGSDMPPAPSTDSFACLLSDTSNTTHNKSPPRQNGIMLYKWLLSCKTSMLPNTLGWLFPISCAPTLPLLLSQLKKWQQQRHHDISSCSRAELAAASTMILLRHAKLLTDRQIDRQTEKH